MNIVIFRFSRPRGKFPIGYIRIYTRLAPCSIVLGVHNELDQCSNMQIIHFYTVSNSEKTQNMFGCLHTPYIFVYIQWTIFHADD